MASIIISILECIIAAITVSRWYLILGYIKESIYEPPDVEQAARISANIHVGTTFLLLGYSIYGTLHVLYDSYLIQLWLLAVYILGYLYCNEIYKLYSRKIKITITPKEQ